MHLGELDGLGSSYCGKDSNVTTLYMKGFLCHLLGGGKWDNKAMQNKMHFFTETFWFLPSKLFQSLAEKQVN